MTGLPGGAFFVGVRGLEGAWRVLDGFLAGSWRAQICARKWLSRGGRVWLSKGVGGFGFRKGWEGFGFRGVGGFGFRKGWGRLDAWACLGLGRLGLGRLGLGMLGAGCSGVWGWAWLATFPFAVWCFSLNPLPLQSLKPRRRHRGAHATVSTQTLTIIINLKTQKNNYGSILS